MHSLSNLEHQETSSKAMPREEMCNTFGEKLSLRKGWHPQENMCGPHFLAIGKKINKYKYVYSSSALWWIKRRELCGTVWREHPSLERFTTPLKSNLTLYHKP